MSNPASDLVIGANKGRYGSIAPLQVPDGYCEDAVNVEWWQSALGKKRPGLTALTMTNGPATAIRLLVRYLASGAAETSAELWALCVAGMASNATGGNAWMRWFRTYDPAPTARRVRQPVLILQGALDRQVTAGQADSLGAAIRAGGNRDVTVRVFPRLNHLFVPSPTDGSAAEYVTLTDASVSAEVLDTLAVWLARRLRGGR